MLPAALRGGLLILEPATGKQRIGPLESRGPRFMTRRWQTQASMPKSCSHTKHNSLSPRNRGQAPADCFFQINLIFHPVQGRGFAGISEPSPCPFTLHGSHFQMDFRARLPGAGSQQADPPAAWLLILISFRRDLTAGRSFSEEPVETWLSEGRGLTGQRKVKRARPMFPFSRGNDAKI